MRQRILPWGALTTLCIAINALFVLFPLLTLVGNSFSGADGLGFDGLARFLATPDYLRGLRNTVVLGVAVTIAATLVGVPFAYIVARYDFPLKNFVALLPVATIIIPEVITCQSWLLVLGNNGFVTKALRDSTGIELPSFYGWGGMIFVMTLVYYTYIYLGTLAALRGFDGQLEEASRSLGRTPVETVFRVVIPTVAPAILVNAMVVFTLVVGNFAVSIILGNRIPLLSIQTYNAFVNEMGGSPVMQSTLSLVMITLVAIVLFVQKRFVERRLVQMAQGRAPAAVRVASWRGMAFAGLVMVVVLLSFLPLVTVFVAAFSESRGPLVRWGTFSLAGIERALTAGVDPILNSLKFASVATAAGIAFAVLASYLIVKKRSAATQALDYLVVLPLTISGTVLGIALVQAFNSGSMVLTGTALIMIVTYVVRRMPFSIRSAASSLYNIPDSLEEASISLGVPPLKTFIKVVVPVMWASVASAFVLMWASTLSELSASIVVYGGGLETLPIAIFRQVDSGRMGPASAYAAVLVVLIVVPIALSVKLLRIRLFATK
ncbi:iron ABC transporter permease [Azospirillum sp. TSA6c]|uniref:ABC transporter permease n=1 Tax=unclassified Azospirillum TaxID=2630922 RepID=UPI000D615882|nr:iron ABC transporter permease [Azospirillum sp. TSA6c]PWC47380.1 iron ABC transporter permease [Azospirillum sp. TSA6c]